VTRLRPIAIMLTLLLVVALAGSALAGFFESGSAGGESVPEEMVDGERIRVEVLNGAGVPGLARDVTRELRRLNFDVVFYGNASGGRRDTSVVLVRAGNLEDARRVADALGIALVRSEPDSTLYLEATVIMGADWNSGRAGDLPADTVSSGQ
jgi:hypothetical protein